MRVLLASILFNVGLFGGNAEHWDWWGTPVTRGPVSAPVEPGGFKIRFQHSRSNAVDYILHKAPIKKPLHGTIVLDYEVTVISGTPQFRYDTDDVNKQDAPGMNPPNCRPILFLNLNSDFGRWFPVGFTEVKPGRYTHRFPISPDKWMSVYGRLGTQDLGEWRHAINNTPKMGVVFGGGFFAGHGILTIKGVAAFTCHSLTVED